MMTISRLIVGIVAVSFGIFLLALAFFVSEAIWVVLIYGLIILGVGIAVLLNENEDKIEEIKNKKSIKMKRGSK